MRIVQNVVSLKAKIIWISEYVKTIAVQCPTLGYQHEKTP